MNFHLENPPFSPAVYSSDFTYVLPPSLHGCRMYSFRVYHFSIWVWSFHFGMVWSLFSNTHLPPYRRVCGNDNKEPHRQDLPHIHLQSLYVVSCLVPRQHFHIIRTLLLHRIIIMGKTLPLTFFIVVATHFLVWGEMGVRK